MKIAFNRARARDVERGILVTFARVATVPIVVNGKQLVAYIGVTKLGELAHGDQCANEIEIADVASALAIHPPIDSPTTTPTTGAATR